MSETINQRLARILDDEYFYLRDDCVGERINAMDWKSCILFEVGP